MNYNFKKIQIVPNSNDFLDIVLSKTQRKTPTVIHKGYAISRIRNFYMRKVKFTQESFDEKLSQILSDFPKLEDIHPFYADLMNVLYDKDHYKLALGQLNTAKHLIDSIGKDYLKLLKFGDSLYRCKQLKRAALGRMATVLCRQKESLGYLEQIRQHLSRLPTIDPNTRTLLICGYPNVGKSSFMNRVSRAEVEVQPYAFTTKSLFVGHFDYQYLRWQVIDTPGILDSALEDRNTIEMQSITALAHIKATILYFFDLSESCGYTITQQISLFENIKPLFTGKPILLVSNKCDLLRLHDLSTGDKALVSALLEKNNALEVELVEASTMTEEGVMMVRNKACDKLLAHRIQWKLRSSSTKVESILNRVHVTMPKPRDDKQRLPFIPSLVVDRIKPDERELEIDLERKAGGAGVYNINLKRHYLLDNEGWKEDIIPEIWNGKNIADFIDPDIEAKLLQLEAEEEEREGRGEYHVTGIGEEEKELKELAKQVHLKRSLRMNENRLAKTKARQPIPMKKQLLKKRRKTAGKEFDSDSDAMDIEEDGIRKDLSERSQSRVKARQMAGFADEKGLMKATKLKYKGQTKLNIMGRQGEADRHIMTTKPKHLFSGKRKAGTHNRR